MDQETKDKINRLVELNLLLVVALRASYQVGRFSSITEKTLEDIFFKLEDFRSNL